MNIIMIWYMRLTSHSQSSFLLLKAYMVETF